MSVVGIDFGNSNSYIGVARQGGIDVIANDYSHGCFKNTLINFKHLIGRKFNDPIVEKFGPYIPCELVELSDGDVGFKVNHLGKEGTQTPEQVLGALLTKMRDTVAANSEKGTKVHDIVLAVPSHFTDVQRRAVLAGVQTAQLNPLRLINESTAIALAYGIYKQDLPAETEKPRIVAFLDCGHSSTQASLVSYHKGKLQMLGTAFDLDVGGLWFDGLLRDHFRKEFSDKYKIDASKNPSAWLHLLDECEKVKKQMSANETAPLNIECVMEDKDVFGSMKVEQFEEAARPLFEKIQALLGRVLSDAQVKPEDVESVEIVGGSSRIPYVRKIVRNVFGQDPKSTLNPDEAVSRGAAMQCALLSPAFHVRDFQIKDCQPYSIRLDWGEANNVDEGQSDVFKDHDGAEKEKADAKNDEELPPDVANFILDYSPLTTNTFEEILEELREP
ncbi:unnamed protein product, partial [Mesorhabditis spiculigera]